MCQIFGLLLRFNLDALQILQVARFLSLCLLLEHNLRSLLKLAPEIIVMLAHRLHEPLILLELAQLRRSLAHGRQAASSETTATQTTCT